MKRPLFISMLLSFAIILNVVDAQASSREGFMGIIDVSQDNNTQSNPSNKEVKLQKKELKREQKKQETINLIDSLMTSNSFKVSTNSAYSRFSSIVPFATNDGEILRMQNGWLYGFGRMFKYYDIIRKEKQDKFWFFDVNADQMTDVYQWRMVVNSETGDYVLKFTTKLRGSSSEIVFKGFIQEN